MSENVALLVANSYLQVLFSKEALAAQKLQLGGPNWVSNWCVAPIIVDPAIDEIYYTPLYYVI